jgi:hypothetical protein
MTNKPTFGSASPVVGNTWKDKVANHVQLGGIETSVLDNGAGKGVRIAWINTGSGLRFKVVPDRAMDIAEAFYNQHSLAWISHLGVTPPNPAASTGINWLQSFGGGLLTTCGLTHVGGPEKDEFGERGVHDRISHTPATIESIVQPDLLKHNDNMSITGTMLQSTVFGPHLLLKRTISARLGHASFTIKDEITNLGNTPAPHMLLYHFNFGWPLVDEGAELIWKGECSSRGGEADNFIFNSGNDFKTCKAPMPEHIGNGEAVGNINPFADDEGFCECAIFNPKLDLSLKLKFKKSELPLLTNWQHWGQNEYVVALEPCTHPPFGQAEARRNGSLLYIQPGETKEYSIEITIV